jgi:hypothetical protein
VALKVDLGTLRQGVAAPNAYLRIEEVFVKALPDVESQLQVDVVVSVYVNKNVRTDGADPIERRNYRLTLDDGTDPLRKRLYTELKAQLTGAQDA